MVDTIQCSGVMGMSCCSGCSIAYWLRSCQGVDCSSSTRDNDDSVYKI